MEESHKPDESDNLYPYLALTNIDDSDNQKINYAVKMYDYFFDKFHEKEKK